MVEFIVKMVKGMIIGISAMTAGAGTFAIILGIYDRCMEIIANPFKHFKSNLKYILPIVIGIGISVIIFGKFVLYCLANYEAYFRCVLLGIIIGGIPTLIKVANKKGFKKKYLISMVIALIFTIILTNFANTIKAGKTAEYISTIELIVYGAIYSFGAVMPGMTTIHILEYMGVLEKIMSGLLAFDLGIIIPFGIGYVILAFTTAGIITYLFKNFYGMTYYAIIGFSITSLVMFIPDFTSVKEAIIGVLLAIVSGIIIYFITRLEDYTKNKKEKIDNKEANHNLINEVTNEK